MATDTGQRPFWTRKRIGLGLLGVLALSGVEALLIKASARARTCLAHEGLGGFERSFSARVRVWRCHGRQPEKRRLAYPWEIVGEFFARTARDYSLHFMWIGKIGN